MISTKWESFTRNGLEWIIEGKVLLGTVSYSSETGLWTGRVMNC